MVTDENLHLSSGERERYSRHLSLPGFSESHQLMLKASRVLVVGCGGLGHPAASYLAAAGIGRMGLADGDVVETSNLQRQIFFTPSDLGRPKAEVLAARISALNPDMRCEVYSRHIEPADARAVVAEYDVVLDCTDHFAARYLLNDTCVALNKPLVQASVYRMEGQLATYLCRMPDGSRSGHYRDLFPDPPAASQHTDCATGGVIGALVGTLGCLQALEVVKVLTGIGEPLANRMLLVDGLTMDMRTISYSTSAAKSTSPATPRAAGRPASGMKEISAAELREWMSGQQSFTLIDVREPYEYAAKNLGGELIPLGEIPGSVDRIPKEGMVVVMCKAGVRSAHAIHYLTSAHGYTNLINLRGGLLAWTD